MNGRSLAVDVGRLLRTSREMHGLSQARLAERAGISQQRLSKVEQGAVDPRLGDLQRLFGGLRLRLRFETVSITSDTAEDPELLMGVPESARLDSTHSFRYLLGKLHDVPHLVGGRLAAQALGLPVRVRRLDLLVANEHRELFNLSLQRFSAVRWSDRWQAFCDDSPPHHPGAMRWLLSGSWEMRVALVDALPERMVVQLDGRELSVPALPWLVANDPDIAELLDRLTAAGWHRPAGSPGAG
jgi:transcriptional regulator with XRE-family HTH domain